MALIQPIVVEAEGSRASIGRHRVALSAPDGGPLLGTLPRLDADADVTLVVDAYNTLMDALERAGLAETEEVQ